MINNVVLVGRMTRDAELRYNPQNQAVATFTLAVNRNFKGFGKQSLCGSEFFGGCHHGGHGVSFQQ